MEQHGETGAAFKKEALFHPEAVPMVWEQERM
jgi:hypothetical protein